MSFTRIFCTATYLDIYLNRKLSPYSRGNWSCFMPIGSKKIFVASLSMALLRVFLSGIWRWISTCYFYCNALRLDLDFYVSHFSYFGDRDWEPYFLSIQMCVETNSLHFGDAKKSWKFFSNFIKILYLPTFQQRDSFGQVRLVLQWSFHVHWNQFDQIGQLLFWHFLVIER